MKKLLLSLLCSAFIFAAQAQVAKKPVPKKVISKKVVKGKPVVISKTKTTVVKNVNDKSLKVKITTDSGIIVVKLYDSTPLHRENFAKLVKEAFYDSLMFHRIIQGFMIQGGDPGSKNA